MRRWGQIGPAEVMPALSVGRGKGRRARRFGTNLMYGRGGHDQSQWESTLAQLETIAASDVATARRR